MKIDTALILIDIQNDYFPGGAMELEKPIEAANNAAKLLAAARNINLPIIHIQHINKKPGAAFFLPGTKGVEIYKSVAPIANENIITKYYPNSFRGTDLDDVLQKLQIQQLIICGMMTHMCVHATVRAAFDLGYTCIVAYDACATKSLVFNNHKISALDVHCAFMAALNGIYAQVKSTDEILNIIK